MLYSYSSALVLLFAATLPLRAATSPVVISEFLASNTTGLRDNFNDTADWIEIRNVSTGPVNLLNWSLTDTTNNLTKWRFPATNLNAGAYMIVFASGRDLRVPGAPLHTSFNLTAGGEYLALVQPDGTNIATQFAPEFPGQAPNVSFGFGLVTSNLTLITTNSLARVRVPLDGGEGTNWTTAGFDDAAWTEGTNGVGFGPVSTAAPADYGAAVLPTGPVGYWRLNEASGTSAANLGTMGAAINGTYQGGPALGTAGPQPPTLPGFESDNRAPTFNGTSSFVSTPTSLLNARGSFTVGGWVKPAVTPGTRIGLFGQNDVCEFGFSSGTTIELWTPGGGSVQVNYPFPMNTWHHIVGVGDGTNLRVYLDGVQAISGGTPTANYGSSVDPFRIGGGGIADVSGNFFNGQIDEVVVYHGALSAAAVLGLYQAGTNNAGGGSVKPYIFTDVTTAMSNVNASAYVRIPFVLDQPTNLSLLTLRMRYDDGFIATINGTVVASANAPASPAFNSVATASHSPSTVDEFRFTPLPGVLQAGTNILAIQGLNLAAGDVDFLVVAELSGTATLSESETPFYFTTPTPGAANSGGAISPGPLVQEVTHLPNVPLDNEDLRVTARITPTFNPVGSVTLVYRIMFNAEVSVPMLDDGASGDGPAGDGVYGAVIPANLSTNGQMIRYYIRALDTQSRVSRLPVFISAADTAEYLGTIVNPTNVTSKLPIFHIFAPTTVLNPGPTTTQVGADSQAGGKVSIFHDGEFYDNVSMALRGNSTAGYNKKSHRLDFNREHQLRHPGPGGRIRKTSFTADYPDPTYMRQRLTFWLCELLGAPPPFYYPVRLELNGVFYQLANHNDVHGEDFLTRIGFDPNGALYNAAGTIVPSHFSTGNAAADQKKTRQWENDADFQTMTAAIAETQTVAQRRTNFFNLFDVPEVIEYAVAGRWVHENDDVWANMSVYRDSDGDGLWRILPFDMNLSWGAIFYEGGTPSVIEGVQATNDVHKGHPFHGSQGATALSGPGAPNNYNRIYDAIFSVAQTREMFLRRMRSMMDRYVKPPGTPAHLLPMENQVLAWRDEIAEEAQRDRAKWGWPPKGGQGNFDPGTNPITDLTNAVNLLISDFIVKRRLHFYGKHSVTNTGLPIGTNKTQNAGIPLSQPPSAVISVAGVEFNPGSTNQAQEYICVTNGNPFAIDISGWVLGGGVDFTFQPGTVMPSNSVLYVSPDVKAFRARTTGPRGSQGLFIAGPYRGQLSARGEPLTITDSSGRLVYTNSYIGAPSLAQQFLRVSELMYHPSALDGNTNAADEFEYLEVLNTSPDTTVSLAGVRLVNGVTFDFTGSAVTSLAADARVLVVKNAAAFAARYGAASIAGEYEGSLENGGERLQLLDASNEEILDFSYNNTWYKITDGAGFSLVIVDPQAAPDAWNDPTQWRPSGALQGSPGAVDPVPPVIPAIVINELLAHSDLPDTDTVELFNPTDVEVDISGWFLTDDFGTPKKYRFPIDTKIPAGGYLTVNEGQFNTPTNAPTSFAFSSAGDEAWVFAADTNGNLIGYADGHSFPATENGVTLGRYTASNGRLYFTAQAQPTLLATNAGPKVGPVVIDEIMYHPPDFANGSDNAADEFIELRNLTPAAIPLFNTNEPASRWRLRGTVDFDFPPASTFAANGALLLVNFDPADATLAAAFRAKYGVAPAVPLFGPYRGKLGNDSGDLRLERPDNATPTEVPYILVDQVQYSEDLPWPTAADGSGASLQKISANAFGNDPRSWTASTPTAGAASAGGTAPSITVQPQSQNGLYGFTTTLSVTASGTGPLRYQWQFNGDNVAGATNATLALDSTQFEQAGTYRVSVFNGAGSATSADAVVRVLIPATFTVQPVGVSLRGSSNVMDFGYTTNNVTFTAQALGNGPVSYQWRFNGVAIPNATGTSYTVTNVDLSKEGAYDVLATDDVGTVPSAPARIVILITPHFILTPLSQVAPAGGQFHMSAVIAGNPPPFGFRWNSNSVLVSFLTSHSRTQFITFPAMPWATNASAQFRLIITNLVSPGNTVNTLVTNFTLPDLDRDGLPDAYEQSLGLSTNNPADALGDLDGDGANNADEYSAGTDPNDPASYLRVMLDATSGVADVIVSAVTNRSYTVQYSDEMPATSWTKLADILARRTSRLETNRDPAWVTNRFYRVVLPAQP